MTVVYTPYPLCVQEYGVKMSLHELKIKKLSLAYFFLLPGLSYGILTSRMPSLKGQIEAMDSDIGFLLLSFGLSGVLSLSMASFIIRIFSATSILKLAVFLFIAGDCALGLCQNMLQAVICMITIGFAFGIIDVCINILGIRLESTYQVSCMGFLHGAYAIGGLGGALLGSLCAAFNLNLFINYTAIFFIYSIFTFTAFSHLITKTKEQTETKNKDKNKARIWASLPLFIICLGLLNGISYAIEGSMAEWGSILLHEEKGASQSLSAMLYAAMCLSLTMTRLVIDRIRSKVSDYKILLTAACIVAVTTLAGLHATNPYLCLLLFCLMGIGAAPVSPILFSKAGAQKTLNAESATSIVAAISYSGLLFFPPFIGFMAQMYTLQIALHIVIIFALIIGAGSFLIRHVDIKNGIVRKY